jgi:integrase
MNDYASIGTPFKDRVKPIPEPISQEEIFNLGKTISGQDKALLYFLYLTGARINEALQVQCRDLRLVSVKLRSGQRVRCIAIDLLTLKRRRGIPRRTIYINPVALDKEMFKEINQLRTSRHKSDDFLFSYGDIKSQRARKKAYWHIHKLTYSIRGIAPPDGKMVLMPDFGLYLHYLRHCRATHLSQTYGYNEHELMMYFGWSSPKPGTVYVNLSPTELIGRMVEVDGAVDATKN